MKDQEFGIHGGKRYTRIDPPGCNPNLKAQAKLAGRLASHERFPPPTKGIPAIKPGSLNRRRHSVLGVK